jgi:hypothetical protein
MEMIHAQPHSGRIFSPIRALVQMENYHTRPFTSPITAVAQRKPKKAWQMNSIIWIPTAVADRGPFMHAGKLQHWGSIESPQHSAQNPMASLEQACQ